MNEKIKLFKQLKMLVATLAGIEYVLDNLLNIWDASTIPTYICGYMELPKKFIIL